MNRTIIYFFLLLTLINISSAETIIYDSVSPSDLKTISISDDLNIGTINEYSYSVYLNGSYLGEYSKNDKIFFPDNANVTIFLPPSNIKTDIGQIWDTGKTQFYIAVMYLISGAVIIFVIIILLRKLWK